MRAYSTLIIALLSTCQAQLTIYNEYGTVNPHPTASASVAVYTGPAAFNPVELSPPPPPSPGTALTMAVDLTGPPNTVNQPIPAGFIGFSIELSVVDQFCGLRFLSAFIFHILIYDAVGKNRFEAFSNLWSVTLTSICYIKCAFERSVPKSNGSSSRSIW